MSELATQPVAITDNILKAAQDPNVDPDKLEKLMGLFERMEDRNREAAFHSAMSDAQSEIGPIATDAENNQTRSRYATYKQLDKALRPIYTKHGFSLSFDTGETDKEETVRVLCYVAHKAGHCKTYHADIASDGKGIKGNQMMTRTHSTGSAMSYGMRYLLKLVFNVAVGEDDTDGNEPEYAISENQVDTLIDKIADVGADKDQFLRYFQIASISELPESRYGEADRLLEGKRKNNAKG